MLARCMKLRHCKTKKHFLDAFHTQNSFINNSGHMLSHTQFSRAQLAHIELCHMQLFHVQLLGLVDLPPSHVYFVPSSSRIQPLLLDLKQVADILPELALLFFSQDNSNTALAAGWHIQHQHNWHIPGKIGMAWMFLAPRASILNHHPRKRMAAHRNAAIGSSLPAMCTKHTGSSNFQQHILQHCDHPLCGCHI